MSCQQLKNSKKYSSLKYTLAILEIVYSLILLFSFQGLGLSKVLAKRILECTIFNIFTVPAYIFIISIVYYLLNFPLNFYQSFIIEHKFCLSNQKIRDWLKDQIKVGVISYIIAIILISAFLFLLNRYPRNWWLVISLFWIFFSLILVRLTPTIIIPLFFKYKKLSDETLRGRIIDLADKMKVKILDCFEIDFSKKTLKGNAAFVGWGKSKRVILADTLKDKYSYDEIEVILAHEFAHYRLKHLLKLILVSSLITLSCFYLIFKTSSSVLRFFSLPSLSDIAALPAIIIYFMFFGIITQPLQNYISRKLERNADRMALLATGLKDAFVSMMEKLSIQNLSDRNPRPIIKVFFFDHPPVDERINMAKSL